MPVQHPKVLISLTTSKKIIFIGFHCSISPRRCQLQAPADPPILWNVGGAFQCDTLRDEDVVGRRKEHGKRCKTRIRAALETYELVSRCRNCRILHIALLPWNSTAPTPQKLHAFTYCAAALKPHQFNCSHAAVIARFHILRCRLGNLPIVPTLQKLHDFTYCAAALGPCQLFA